MARRARLLAACVVSSWWSASALNAPGAVRSVAGKSAALALRSPLSQATAARGNFSRSCTPFPGKRVVLATVDQEYAEMFGSWLHSAKPFLRSTEHLHVIAEDHGATDKLKAMLNKSGVEGTVAPYEQLALLPLRPPYGAKKYGSLVWKRPDHILRFLQQGCTVLYVDIDTVWKDDPFLDIGAARPQGSGSPDLYLTRDEPHPQSIINFCTCFMYINPTAAARQLMEDWRGHSVTNMNQKAFNRVLANDRVVHYAVLPFARYPPGMWADYNPRPAVLHANWLRGIDNKVSFMKCYGVWYPPSLASAPHHDSEACLPIARQFDTSALQQHLPRP